MNDIIFPVPGKMLLLVAPAEACGALFEMTARLALQAPLQVLDGGNCFNAYEVAKALRRRVPDPQPALNRIQLARAFTCYQMLSLLEGARRAMSPVLVLDMFATYLDEGVPLVERQRLMSASIEALKVISNGASAAVWVRSRTLPQPEAAVFLDLLAECAGLVWRLETPRPPANQLKLF